MGSKPNIFVGLAVIIIITLIVIFSFTSKQSYPVDEKTLTKGKNLFSTQPILPWPFGRRYWAPAWRCYHYTFRKTFS